MHLDLLFEQDCKESHGLIGLVSSTAEAVQAVFNNPFAQERYNVVVASEQFIRRLNRDYRQVDSVTDVLSFPLPEGVAATGEIYICWARVVSQAEEYGHSWQREFCYLLVHGILHLLGYEHGAKPNPKMRSLEEDILGRLKLGRI